MTTKLNGLQKHVFMIGVIGGLVMTFGMMLSRAIDVTPMNFELSLGALLTTQIDAVAWLIGFIAHLAISGAVAFVYVAGFKLVGRKGPSVGLQFGVLHWAISGVGMLFIPRLFSLMPGIVSPPGLFGSNFGAVNFVSNLLVHLLFGSVVGELYARVVATAAPGVSVPALVLAAPEDKRVA